MSWIYHNPTDNEAREMWDFHTRHVSYRITKAEGSKKYQAWYRLPFCHEWFCLQLPSRIDGKWDIDAHNNLPNVMDLVLEKDKEMCECETVLGRLERSR